MDVKSCLETTLTLFLAPNNTGSRGACELVLVGEAGDTDVEEDDVEDNVLLKTSLETATMVTFGNLNARCFISSADIVLAVFDPVLDMPPRG